MSNVTAVCTSCNRPDLLEKTLDTFFANNTYELADFIIIDDSTVIGCNDHLLTKYPQLTLIYNEENLGQIASIDKAYSQVKTDYVFHLEEDWEFFRPGFIQDAMEIIDIHDKLICVWARDPQDTPHPTYQDTFLTPSGKKVKQLIRDFHGHWTGFTFNPSLKKMKDYSGYAQIGRELQLSVHYGNLGYFAMIFEEGYCRHTGWGRHVTDKGE